MQTPKSVPYAGKSVDRVEGHEKVTGRAHYAADTQLADLTYGVLVQSDVPHGAVTAESMRASVDRASESPGVLDVLNPLNCPPLQVLPRELTFDLPLERRPPLSDLTVQHVGQHMAMVVADSLENATHAASLFRLEYQRGDAVMSATDVVNRSAARDEKDGQIRHGS